MAWNEPGGNGKDPWGNRKNEGPPDLDEVFKKFQQKISAIFGGGGSGSGSKSNNDMNFWLLFIIMVTTVVWFLYGFNIIKEEEQGVVLRFGKYIETREAGLTWIAPLINTLEKVKVSTYRTTPKIQAVMLTEDENIVEIAYTVQYNVYKAEDYVFNVKNPNQTLIEASESAMREIVAANTMDNTVGERRSEIPLAVKSILQDILDKYKTGLSVINVNLTEALQPAAVRPAFDDVTRAREDKKQYVRKAEAYSNSIIPEARGEGRKLVEEAKGYKARTVNAAEGEATRFTKLLIEYQKAPKVTRERLYIESIETLLSNSNKIMIDADGNNNLLYLPIDKLLRDKKEAISLEPLTGNSSLQSEIDNYTSKADKRRSNLRNRGAR